MFMRVGLLACRTLVAMRFLIVLFSAWEGAFTPPNTLAELQDKAQEEQVVAEVNGTRIQLGELESALERQLGPQRFSMPETEMHGLRQRVLERLVDRELLLIVASQKKLTPAEAEVDTFMGDIREERGGREAFVAMLSESGLTEAEFRKGLRADIAIKRYLDREVFSGLHVADEEVESSYRANPTQFSVPQEVHVRHILIRVGKEASAEDAAIAKKRAVMIAEEAKSGADFAQLAREYSETHNKVNGGDLGFITENQLEPEFSKAAFALKVGEVSEPVRTKFGFHLIKVEERRKGAAKDLLAQKAQFRDSLLEEKKDAALQSALTRLRRDAKIILYVK